MLVDTHAHLNFDAFSEDREEIITDCFSQDIAIVNVGTNTKTTKKAVQIAQKHKKPIKATVGLHPYHVVNSKTKEELNLEKYKNLAENPEVSAIGEIGLDYTYTDNGKEKELQQAVFKKQLKLAQELQLPVVIHCREAWDDLLSILRNPAFKLNIKNNKNGVAHFYAGSWDQAQKLFALGFLISFTGVVTFSKEYNKIIKKAPLKKLMLETDCPYVAPEPHRGKRNKPQYVKYVAEKIAKIKEEKVDSIKNTTTKTARKFFKF
jgi:TatD DNase family protein